MGEIDLRKAHELYQKGVNGKKRCFKKAIKIYKKLAKKGNIDAMYYYANMLYNGDGVKKDKQKAKECYNKIVKHYENRAKNKNEDAIEKLYNMISNKRISVTDEEKAKYYKMAADNGNVDAMNSYAWMLNHGEGIPENKKKQ